MIAQKFEYTAPKSLDEALHLLASGAKPIAGGITPSPRCTRTPCSKT